MAKDLRLDVITTEDGRGLRTAADDLDKLAAKTDVGTQKFHNFTQESSRLDSEIDKVKQKTRELGHEFEQTGSKDVYKALRQNINYGNQLEKLKNDLHKAFSDSGDDSGKSFFGRFFGFAKTQGESIGEEFSRGFEGGVSGLLTNPTAWLVAAPAIVVAGNAIGGALLTGIGLAGIGAGIAGQIHDPRVTAAGAELGKEVSAGFKDATSSFAEPLVRGIHIFGAEWTALQPGLRSTFTSLAPLVTSLAEGAAGFVRELAPGLERAAVASKPLVQDFSAWLPKLGSELGSLFDTMAAHSKEAEQGLQMLEDGISGIVVITRDAIPVFAKLGDALSYINTVSQIKRFEGIQDEAAHVGALGSAMYDAAAKAGDFATSEVDAAKAAEELNTKIKDLFGVTMSVDEATLKWHEDLTGLVRNIDKAGRSLDENTAAGQKNTSVLLDAAQSAERLREANIAAGMSVDEANKKYDDQISQLIALAIKLGLNKDQVQRLLDKYRELAKAPDISKNVDIHYNTYGGAGPYANKPIPHASGGPVTAGMTYLVGEERPELFVPDTSGYILPEVPQRGYGRPLAGVGIGGGTATAVRVMQPIQLVTPSGKILWETQVEYALDTGRTPAELWPDRR